MTPPRIVLLNNPGGGYNMRCSLKEIEDVAFAAEIKSLRVTTPAEVTAALRSLAGDPPDILAINSGDGTVNMVVAAMRNDGMFTREPALALLKGGTTNMIHRDAGHGSRPAKALKSLLRQCRKGMPAFTVRRPLKITIGDGLGPPLYGFFLCAGALPRIILAARRHAGSRLAGPVQEILAVFRMAGRLVTRKDFSNDPILRPDAPSFTSDGVSTSAPGIFVAMTTLHRLILGLHTGVGAQDIALLTLSDRRRARRRFATTVVMQAGRDAWMLDGEIHPPAVLAITPGAPLRFWTGA